jgi:hypothetical protein
MVGRLATVDDVAGRLPIPRRTALSRFWVVLFTALLVLPGCSGTRIESQHFGSSGAIERAFERHYARNATEGNCYNPSIDGFTRVTVLEDTPERLVVHARYLFRDRFQDRGGGGGDGRGSGAGRCTGFGERTFSLTRSPEGALIVAMDGQQQEPALRTVLRRLFPN